MNLRYLWDRLTGRWRRCWLADGYCLSHHTSRCVPPDEEEGT